MRHRRLPRTVAVLAAILCLASIGRPLVVDAAITSADSGTDAVTGDTGDRSITFLGVIRDEADLEVIGLGHDGYWFAQFDASTSVTDRPTGEHAVHALPPWMAPLNHTTGAEPGCDVDDLLRGCLPGYYFRSFSQDGPARSAGGHQGWAELVLPNGDVGTAGAIVDPHTAGNTNNTINRVQLQDGVPSSFHFSVVVDVTNLQHEPTTLVVRGNVGLLDADVQVDPVVEPTEDDLGANGTPDVYVFRVEEFRPGDYLKLRLKGPSEGGGAGFAGFLVDVAPPPLEAPRPGPV